MSHLSHWQEEPVSKTETETFHLCEEDGRVRHELRNGSQPDSSAGLCSSRCWSGSWEKSQRSEGRRAGGAVPPGHVQPGLPPLQVAPETLKNTRLRAFATTTRSPASDPETSLIHSIFTCPRTMRTMSTRRVLLPTAPQAVFTHVRRVLGSVLLQDLVHTRTPSPVRPFQSICGQMSQVCVPVPSRSYPTCSLRKPLFR